jgi:hypothetical protein
MCNNVIIHYNNGDEFVCETQFDLMRRMPFGLELGEDDFDGACCLCTVDLNKTAVLNGFICSKLDTDDKFDPFDTHFYQL